MSHREELFRSEALDNQCASWLGPILLIWPPRLKWLIGGATLITAVLVAFLVWGEYTKKARVPGYLAPDQGVLKVFAPQSGTVLEQHVQEGQSVTRGELLFVLSGKRASPSLRRRTSTSVGSAKSIPPCGSLRLRESSLPIGRKP